MRTEHDVKINGGGDSAALRDELKNELMKLSEKEQYELLREYAEKYGINLHKMLT